MFFFFFQAEDGIRDADVTGVQTCALPIFADLIEGTFDAIVDASIQQMKAYGALLQEVAEAVDQFLLERDDRCLRQQQHAVADALLTGIYRITRGEPR